MIFLLVLCFALFFTSVTCSIVHDLLHGKKEIIIKFWHPSHLPSTEWDQLMGFVLDLIDQEMLFSIRPGNDMMNVLNTFSKRMPILFPDSTVTFYGFDILPRSTVYIKKFNVKPGERVKLGQNICSFKTNKKLAHFYAEKNMIFLKPLVQPGSILHSPDVFIGMTLGDSTKEPDIEGFRKWHRTIKLLQRKPSSTSGGYTLEQKMKHVRRLQNEYNKTGRSTDLTATVKKQITLTLQLVLTKLFYDPDLLKGLSTASIKDIEQVLAICATSFTFSTRNNFESPTVQGRKLFGEYKNFIRPFYRSRSGGSVDMALEFSKASFKTGILGLQYWECKMLGDAELFFDEENLGLYLDVYYKFIVTTFQSNVNVRGNVN